MDAIRISRKRKHSSSSRPHPLSGTLTRSKYQIFLHCNRSGHFHSDSARRQQPYASSRRSRSHLMGCITDIRQGSSENDGNSDDDDDVMVLIKDLRKKPNPNPNGEDSTCDGEDLSRVLIKDLRRRRVYSPQSNIRACSDLNGVVDSDCGDKKIAGLGFGPTSSVEKDNSGCEKVKGESDRDCDMNVDGVINTRIVATENSDLGLSPQVPNFDQGIAEVSYVSSELQNDKQCDGKNDGNCSEKIAGLSEELVLTTPPDAKVCDNSEVNGDEGKPEEEVRVGVEDTPLVENDDKNVSKGFPPKVDDSLRNDSVLKSKPVLRPRSHKKLFKIPGTVSYKRLFPFLMEIMGDDFGTSKLGYCQKNEKGVNGGQEFQLPLSSQSQEGSKCELKTDSCTILDTSQSGALEGDASHVNELSHGNGSKLQSKEVTSECLSVPSLNDICLSESKAGPTADFHCVRDVCNSLHNDDFKQDSNHKRNLDHAKATNHGGCTSERCGVSNEECVLTIPPDAVICDNPEVNLSQLESMSQDMLHVKPMGLTRSTPENSGEGFCVTADKRKDPVLNSKSVPRPNLNRKLFKTPGSVSYRRMLPFLKDLTKDDSVMSEFCHPTLHQKDEVDMYAKKFEVPLLSQGREASIDEHKTDSGHMHVTVKCNALVNNVLVDPANELSHGNQPKLSPSPGLPESPMQLDAKVVNELSAPSLSEHIEKVEIGSKDVCLSDSKLDFCSVTVDSQCVKNVANAEHNDGFEQVQNKIYRQHNSESTPKAQNLLYINGDVSSLAFENCSSKEKGFTINCDERKQFEGMEKRESFIRNPPEGQSLNHLDPNMLDAEKEARSKIIYEKSDMQKHASDKAENDLNGIVYGPSVPSKGSNNESASCVGKIRNGSESKTLLALNRCSRMKLLKHAGFFSYKRMLPFILNTMKDNPYVSVIDHYPKIQKCLDQTPLPAISASDLQITPISGSDDCRGNSGTQQETGLHAHVLNNDTSSPISQVPESQSSHDSCKVIQLQDELVVLNGCCNLESSPDPSISVHKIDSPITPLGPTVNEVITREEEAISPIPMSFLCHQFTLK